MFILPVKLVLRSLVLVITPNNMHIISRKENNFFFFQVESFNMLVFNQTLFCLLLFSLFSSPLCFTGHLLLKGEITY